MRSFTRKLGPDCWEVVWFDNRDDGTGETVTEYVTESKAKALIRCGAVVERA